MCSLKCFLFHLKVSLDCDSQALCSCVPSCDWDLANLSRWKSSHCSLVWPIRSPRRLIFLLTLFHVWILRILQKTWRLWGTAKPKISAWVPKSQLIRLAAEYVYLDVIWTKTPSSVLGAVCYSSWPILIKGSGKKTRSVSKCDSWGDIQNHSHCWTNLLHTHTCSLSTHC